MTQFATEPAAAADGHQIQAPSGVPPPTADDSRFKLCNLAADAVRDSASPRSRPLLHAGRPVFFLRHFPTDTLGIDAMVTRGLEWEESRLLPTGRGLENAADVGRSDALGRVDF
jgi:hypothetical protein